MSDANELEDFTPLKTVPTYDLDSDGCMERNDEGWGDWVRDDDARGLLRRIAELESLNRNWEKSCRAYEDEKTELQAEVMRLTKDPMHPARFYREHNHELLAEITEHVRRCGFLNEADYATERLSATATIKERFALIQQALDTKETP